MRAWHNHSHGRWLCRSPIVTGPTYRQKAIFGRLRKDIGPILQDLCEHMGLELVEGHAMPDHGYRCVRMPPKASVAHAIGRVQGQSAIRMHRDYPGRVRTFTGLHFWARGYGESTVGCDEAVTRQDIRNQEPQEQRVAQLALGEWTTM